MFHSFRAMRRKLRTWANSYILGRNSKYFEASVSLLFLYIESFRISCNILWRLLCYFSSFIPISFYALLYLVYPYICFVTQESQMDNQSQVDNNCLVKCPYMILMQISKNRRTSCENQDKKNIGDWKICSSINI